MDKSTSQRILFLAFLTMALGQFLHAVGSLIAAHEKQQLPAGEVKPPPQGQSTTTTEKTRGYFDA